MSEIIRAEGLEFSYHKHDDSLALSNINISINRGEFLAILGHNGSGKSTLAKHFNALLLPSAGAVWVNGLCTSEEANHRSIRQSAGMVFQNPDNQIIAATVEEDVAFGPENLGIPSAQIKERVAEALSLTGMTSFRHHAPHLLSGGQKQRLAIAGVIAMRPQCLILDEPTAMIDPRGRQEVLDTVRRLNREEGITVIYISHFMEEAIAADRVLILNRGSAIMDGRPREIFQCVEELRDVGLDVPPVAELVWQLRLAGVDIKPDIMSVDELVEALCY